MKQEYKIFIHFLKDNGAYNSYLDNMANFFSLPFLSLNVLFEKFDELHSMTRCVSDFFPWSSTVQRRESWVQLNAKWLRYCLEHYGEITIAVDIKTLAQAVKEWEEYAK